MILKSKTFAQLKLRPAIQKALDSEGYQHPTPIQAATIPHLLKGRDLIGCAQTGTGKTAAFALPILNYIDQFRRAAVPKTPRILILSPTRELATQIGESFQTYGKNLKFRQTVIYGGISANRQIRVLTRGVHILVATPGRLLDLMNQGHVSLKEIEIFVLDEADRMLDMGFLPDLKRIINQLPEQRQSLFFSATMPPKVAHLAQTLLSDPIKIEITPPATTVDLIDQKVMFVSRENKRELLPQVLQKQNYSSALVFTRTKRLAEMVAARLSRQKFKAAALHGNKSQSARERILESFKQGKTHVLVATDLAARGLDVEGITHVINYDVPQEPDSYVHRIGRTGRAGMEGTAITFCEPSSRKTLREIEKLIGKEIEVDTDHEFHIEPKSRPKLSAADIRDSSNYQSEELTEPPLKPNFEERSPRRSKPKKAGKFGKPDFRKSKKKTAGVKKKKSPFLNPKKVRKKKKK